MREKVNSVMLLLRRVHQSVSDRAFAVLDGRVAAPYPRVTFVTLKSGSFYNCCVDCGAGPPGPECAAHRAR